MKVLKKLLQKALNNVVGKKSFQSLFESLFCTSLRGLNCGDTTDFSESGELNVLKYVKERFNSEKSIVIFDGGGNIGNYSRALADFFKGKAIIHSFEPSKKTYERFLETTKDIQNIIPNNCGLSDIENYQLLYTDTDGSGFASIYKRNLKHYGISLDKSEEIKLSTIDNYCKENNIDRIHFLKLDIEGHELKALNGANKMIRSKKIDVIQFEFGECNIDSRTYFQDFYYLLNDNYRIYRILKDGLWELHKYEVTYEIFRVTNYLAVRK